MSNSLVPNDFLINHTLKLHYFVPSERKLWTIVGKNNEYWLDPELDHRKRRRVGFAGTDELDLLVDHGLGLGKFCLQTEKSFRHRDLISGFKLGSGNFHALFKRGVR